MQRAPCAAGLGVEAGGDGGHLLAVVLRRPQAGAGGQHEPEMLGEPLIDPEQGALHRAQVVRRQQPLGPPVLAVPGVHELVGQEAGERALRRLLDEGLLVRPVVARFVMLEAEVLDVIGEREQPVVGAVVAGAEERQGLLDQARHGRREAARAR